ncbi:hypothetical protein SAY86_003589 [Trapa natans]|uniref:C2H2-type domain-containing protein n=1 Tax=Trapa natans TaxID=22666 RepID=A0AAN7MEF2_TRANT|nr:hypothetical protein SAY86_003589 [Trapa natans]
MPSATSTDTAADDSQPFGVQSLPQIDLRLLSQSELYSLSLLSGSSPSPSSQDDVVVPIPKIDRSIFNESAGSRKQTYFRLRLAPRTAANLPHTSDLISRQKTPEPLEEKNSCVITLLKDLFAHHIEPEPPLPSTPEEESSLIAVPVVYDDRVPESSNSVLQSIPIGVVDVGFSKRKRGRPRKFQNFENSDGKEALEFEVKYVKDSIERASPVAALNLDCFEQELKRMTEGMRTEEDLSVFLSGLSGHWGSKRKKGKIVDARCFGDVLPIGWKLLLVINSVDDRAWLGCSLYISPEGYQFASLKDVSAHLSFRVEGAVHDTSGPAEQIGCGMASENPADPTLEKQQNQDEVVSLSAVPIDHPIEAPLHMGENLRNSQTKELYRCHKCTMTFEEKDNLLLHLLSSHKKSRNMSSGAKDIDSVIMKDGKYECQLCHKLFQEKNRFSSHFGIHIKDYVKRVDASGETDCAHKMTPKVQEPITSERVSTAINTEDVEQVQLNFPPHSKIETSAVSKARSSSEGHHVNIHPIVPIVMSEKNEEHVAEYFKKEERSTGLSNIHIGVVDEANKNNSEFNVSKDLTAASYGAHSDKASETPKERNVYTNENKVNMNSVSSMEGCRQGMVPMDKVFSATKNNNIIDNESLVNSLFGSPVEDMDMDDEDGLGDSDLIPGIENRCFGLMEGVPNSDTQKISSEGCPLIQFGSNENSVNSDDLTGTQTSGLEIDSRSGICLPSSGQVLLPNDNPGKVIGGRIQQGSFNAWKSEKPIDFSRNITDGNAQEVGSSFPVIRAANEQPCDFDENLKSFSAPKLQSAWQQGVFETNILPAHQKPLSSDVKTRKISSDTMRNFQSLAESQSVSPVLNHAGRERRSGGTFPFAPLDQQAFVLHAREAHVPSIDKPKEYRGLTGLYAGNHKCHDNSSENHTVSNTVHKQKQGQPLSSSWNDKSSFIFDGRYPLQHGGPVMGFEKWTNPPRSSEVLIPQHRRASPFGSAIEDMKRNKESVFGIYSFGVDHQHACTSGYNLDMFGGGALPDNGQAGNLGTFRNNEQMIGQYSQQQHKHHEEAMARSMWREEQNCNILQNSNLSYVSPSAGQPSVSFPAFNLISDKVQNELYPSNQKHGNTQVVAGGVRTGGSGSFMEYNFLSVPPSAQGSHISSFNQQMGQGFESNWIEKDSLGLFPKTGGASSSSGSRHHQHQVTALCVLCGNQFSHDGHFDAGDGSVSYMCFNCKAKFAGQINFF